jgi:hypothetical protein
MPTRTLALDDCFNVFMTARRSTASDETIPMDKVQGITEWLNTKIVRPLRQMTWYERACVLVVGVLGGLFPVPALTTLVTLALAPLFSLNAAQVAVASAINLMLTGVEIAMIPTFATVGALLLGGDSSLFTLSMIQDSLKEGIMMLLRNASHMLMYACVAWALMTVVGIAAMKYIGRNQHARQY